MHSTANSKSRSSWLDRIPSLSDDPSHPAQIALRTYALALSLSLGPSVVPLIATLLVPGGHRSSTSTLAALRRVLKRELSPDGFAFAVTLNVAGGAALRRCWHLWRTLSRVDPQTIEKPGADHSSHDHQVASPDANTSKTPATFALHQKAITCLSRFFSNLTAEQETFFSYIVSSFICVLLLQAGRERAARLRLSRHSPRSSLTSTLTSVQAPSPTLDLTLLLLVRAIDSLVQGFIVQRSDPLSDRDHAKLRTPHVRTAEPTLVRDKLQLEKVRQETEFRQKVTSQVDAFVFWACSARIMWCFFYEPDRLPQSYVVWIKTLANLDGRVIETLQHIRAGRWSYKSGSTLYGRLLQDMAEQIGYPSSWGDPSALPAYGGASATKTWKALGVPDRRGVGGIPCEMLHRPFGQSLGLESSCTVNALTRTLKAFGDALAIYLPVHFLPVLLTKPQILLRPHRLLQTILGATRSAAFLSSFIGIYWYSVCLTRSVVLARLFPFISHDFWDGPFGCIMAGCLMCGSSIWIEHGARRGEMALYVLPRAIRSCLPEMWLKSRNQGVRIVERLVFVVSMASLLTAASHRPNSLRGLSRWTLAFITNGPSAGFWKRKRQDPSIPPTPYTAVTPIPRIPQDESSSNT